MDIHIDEADAEMVVGLLDRERIRLSHIVRMRHITDAELHLARLERTAASRVIATLRRQLEARV